jgi:hypothetical protein
MASKDSKRLRDITRELAKLHKREEELRTERRTVAYQVSQPLVKRWLKDDTAARRWNVSPPPIPRVAERA